MTHCEWCKREGCSPDCVGPPDNLQIICSQHGEPIVRCCYHQAEWIVQQQMKHGEHENQGYVVS